MFNLGQHIMRNYNLDNNGHPIYVHTQYEEGQVVTRNGRGGGDGNSFLFFIALIFFGVYMLHVSEGNVKPTVKPVETQQQQVAK
jgi:hypothetical protein